MVETELIGELQINEEELTVTLLTIYDKADTATITYRELKELIKALQQEGW